MANRREHPGPLPRGGRREKHGWLRFDRYQVIHEGALERHSFVIEDRTVFSRGADAILLEGTIVCEGRVVVEVTKLLDVRRSRNGQQVRGLIYRYNAHQTGGFNILRYDNQHQDAPDEYHRHEYNPRTGDVVSETTIGREDMPTLIEMISEVERLAKAASLL